MSTVSGSFSNNNYGLFVLGRTGESGKAQMDVADPLLVKADSITFSVQRLPSSGVYEKPQIAVSADGKPPLDRFGVSRGTSHDRIADWAALDFDRITTRQSVACGTNRSGGYILMGVGSATSDFFGADFDALRERTFANDQDLNTLISGVLKVNGISLGQFEKIGFSVNQDGKVAVKGEGITDEKREAIEDALNRNSSVGQSLLFSQAQRKALANAVSREMYMKDDAVTERIILETHLNRVYGASLADFQLTGEFDDSGKPYISGPLSVLGEFSADDVLYQKIGEVLTKDQNRGGPPEYSFEFSYMDGAVMHPDEADPQRIFNDSQNDVEDLAKLLGLEGAHDRESIRVSLGSAVETETVNLNVDLNKLFKKAGLENLTRKVTFSEDRQGSIVIEGNIRDDQKAALAKLVNDDPVLVERLKTQKAKMEVLAELNKSTYYHYTVGDIYDIPSKAAPPDLNSDSLAAARKQLLKDYLKQNAGVDLADVDMKFDSATGSVDFSVRYQPGNETADEKSSSLLAGFKGMQHELKHYFENPKHVTKSQSDSSQETTEEKTPLRQLLSMKRGVLSEEKEPVVDLNELVGDFYADIRKEYVSAYNSTLGEMDSNSRIVDFTVETYFNGRTVIKNVQTRGNDPKANRQAELFMNKMLAKENVTREIAGQIAERVLAEHDDEHGDVLENPHVVTFKSGKRNNYSVSSAILAS